jgi:hypothetical protein
VPLPARTTTIIQADPELAADSADAGARLEDAMRRRYGPDWHMVRFGPGEGPGSTAADLDDEAAGHWHTVHIVVRTPDVAAARSVGHIIATMAAEHPLVVRGATTVSCETRPNERHAVYCDAALGGGRRCVRMSGHLGDHSPTEQPV